MYAKTTIVGRLGRDPELKYTAQGTPVCSFSVATDQGYGDKKKTVWYRVSAWQKLAEICNQYLKKGRQVLVDGEIAEPVPWQAKDGTWKASLELTARNVTFLGERGESSEPREERQEEPKKDATLLDTEEIPFR